MIRIIEWDVVPETCTLRRIETKQESRLSPRGMEVLVYLVENHGKVVTSHELLERFWSKSVVSDHAVHNVIAEIRGALGDSASKPRYIKTFPKRGYSLLAELGAAPSSSSAAELGANSRFIAAVSNPSNLRLAAACLLVGSLLGFAVTLASSDVTDSDLADTLDSPGATSPTSLLVVPFERFNIAGENRDWVGQFVEHFPSIIANIPNIQVKKNLGASARDLIGQDPPLVDYVLTGSVLQANAQVRLSLELVDTSDGTVRFFDQFDLGSEAIFSVQDDITSHIVTALSIYLDEEQRRAMLDWGTKSASAYNHFLKAEFHSLQANELDFNLAIESYSLAIDEDPDFLNAHLGLANAASRKGIYAHNSVIPELATIVNNELREAIRLQADEEATLTTQILALRIEGTNQQLIEQVLRELILTGDAPSFAYEHYAVYLTSARMYDEARQFLQLEHGDNSFIISPDSAWNYPSRLETPANLVSIKKRQLLKRPSHVSLISSLVRSAAFTGDFALANKHLEQQLQLDRNSAFTMLSQVIVSALAGSSIAEGDKLEREHLGNPNYNFSYGAKRFILGDIEGGIALWKDLNAAETRRLFNFIDSTEVFFPESVWQDPRYLALLDEIGVGKTWQRQLMKGVEEMSTITGVELNAKSQAAYEANEFMSRNNLWDHDAIAYPDIQASIHNELSVN